MFPVSLPFPSLCLKCSQDHRHFDPFRSSRNRYHVIRQSYMRLMPAAVQEKYDFECFAKGGADHDLLDLTVNGAQPVAALHRQLKEVRK